MKRKRPSYKKEYVKIYMAYEVIKGENLDLKKQLDRIRNQIQRFAKSR